MAKSLTGGARPLAARPGANHDPTVHGSQKMDADRTPVLAFGVPLFVGADL